MLVNLIVSDDGSTDDTLQIVNTHSDDFHSVRILQGPGRGACANFFSIIPYSTSEFMAFADQDDIWNPDRLINSIERLKDHGSTPALTFSSALQFYDSDRGSDIFPKFTELPNFERMFVECFTRGCTMTLNKSAVDLLAEFKPMHATMHDWWSLLILKSCGAVIYEKFPEISYRVHSENATGLGERSIVKTLKKIRGREWEPYSQVVEFYQLYSDKMDPVSRLIIKNFIDRLEGTFFRRFFGLVISKARYRTTFYNELRTRLGFLFFPILFRVERNSTMKINL